MLVWSLRKDERRLGLQKEEPGVLLVQQVVDGSTAERGRTGLK
jgi:hypothetical protein